MKSRNSGFYLVKFCLGFFPSRLQCERNLPIVKTHDFFNGLKCKQYEFSSKVSLKDASDCFSGTQYSAQLWEGICCKTQPCAWHSQQYSVFKEMLCGISCCTINETNQTFPLQWKERSLLLIFKICILYEFCELLQNMLNSKKINMCKVKKEMTVL